MQKKLCEKFSAGLSDYYKIGVIKVIKLICFFNFLTVRWANFIEVLTAVPKLFTVDVTETQRRHTLTKIILTAHCVASSLAGTYGEGREVKELLWFLRYVVTKINKHSVQYFA